ncbi:hypothetical protein LIPSTDRAFT_5106 [Lipomyces starkeyi NRRL Y-11557]|uniref:Uncharacterized protein n=1 Tax=Lipomyces starkeyi NRRL Y-11557 TaxID=675824 RepID=A0A1E3Q065_LIPST|nr:hypothetical protein LIPSTDRAFT_5106 [Lipomyces starkeyi NRRL Y-11557]
MELVYAAVMKKKQHQEEDDTWESCRCSTWNRYLLPCSHRIQLGVPISITQIDPRWWVHPEFLPVNVAFQRIDAAILLELKDPVATLPRKGRPNGTRRLQTPAEVVQLPTASRNNLIITENEATAKEQEEPAAWQNDEAQLQDDESISGHDRDYRHDEVEEMWSDVFCLFKDGK